MSVNIIKLGAFRCIAIQLQYNGEYNFSNVFANYNTLTAALSLVLCFAFSLLLLAEALSLFNGKRQLLHQLIVALVRRQV